MSEEKLRIAHELFQAGQYDAARAILETIKDDPTAREWLETLDEVAPVDKRLVKPAEPVLQTPAPVHQPVAQQYQAYDRPMFSTREIEIANARGKSYVGAAILTFILYWVFWIPGIIFNYMYLQDARKMQRIAGHSLPGVGCLWVLLIINVGWIFVLCSVCSGTGILGGLGG